jgi:hypothetical protein
MPSWHLLDAIAGRALDSTFGGRVKITPMTAVDQYGDPTTDGTRPEQTIAGHLATDPKTGDFRGSVIGTEVRGGTRLSVDGETSVVFTAAAYESVGYALRKGDLLTFLDEKGTPTFSIAKAPHHQGQDVEVYLAREKAA